MSSSISVIGNLTSDPELKFTESGKCVCTFTIADNHRVLNQQTKEWENGTTSFFRVTCWEKLGENVAESLRKGQRAMVMGKLTIGNYEDANGVTKTRVNLTADSVGPELTFATAIVQPVTKRAEVSQSVANSYVPDYDEPF